jgi:hypothetical protein
LINTRPLIMKNILNPNLVLPSGRNVWFDCW